MHPAALDPAVLMRQVAEARTRRSGPGGQHRNKVETAVILVHEPTGISAEASERRSQAENRRVALQRLRLKLAIEHKTPIDPSRPSALSRPSSLSRPSPLWRSRIRGRQLVVAADHDDYPALVAEALDRLQAVGFEIAPAAVQLGVSGTQLVRLFRKSSASWVALNERRVAAGLPALK